ncbi:hypothetical protein BLS_009461 [Venturia inaequalis]|uniref:GH64 domain-containing protein n=1 Tax=Venturia inaequalis TaxID=5025 RepID=A0A8H3YZC7_VENIN|nr:hypothetical protein EG328_001527 [Venturia inaequalis]KAE9979780.1 hypothetical protein BLS_009461 [Venturia inaequalis]KAE9991517.1 hypothetical protein EG327_011537 [Venturia inaequalis]RDI86684.1 hypothetical protein Vi05172_g3390 [Venturia inaequalis]
MRGLFRRVVTSVKKKFPREKGTNQTPIQAQPAHVNASIGIPATILVADRPQDVSQAPLTGGIATDQVAAPGPTLQVALVNHMAGTINCYVTGQAINNNYAVYLLRSDGKTPYYPPSPASTGSALAADCSIPIPPGTKTITVPQTAGGRIWFSVGNTLTFLINPGPALVEPSVTNEADPNINISWAFAEFTFNSSQLYANITYVDFVAFPIALSLTNTSGNVTTVEGMAASGLDRICSDLQAQSNTDSVAGWRNLIVTLNGKNLRALSPNNGMMMHSEDFNNYYDAYVNEVWSRYITQPLNIAASGLNVSGQTSTSTGQLVLGGESFSKPTTADVFSSNSGPFETGSSELRNQIIPQLAAAFNRSTLLTSSTQPTAVNQFYKDGITNHFSRIVHAANAGGKGYAFPYDDVEGAGGDQSGFVNDINPELLTVTVRGL